MATPTTVLEFAQNAVDANTTAKADAQAALTTAQTDLVAARAARDAATTALLNKEKDITAKRAEIAAADTPAEAAALAAELATLVAELRVLQTDLLEARDDAAEAAKNSEHLAAMLARVNTRLNVALGDLVTATLAEGQRDAVKAAATTTPLDTLATRADDALGETEYTEAETRITDAIPTKLLAAARKGHELETARVARLKASEQKAEDLLMAELEANGGVDGLVDRRQLELERAERNLRDWTDTAVNRFDRAMALLSTVRADPAVLSAAELAGVEALDDTPGQDAADLRVALLDARIAVLAAELDLEEATAEALAPDPSADVSAVTAVSDAQDALDTATTALTTAQTDYNAADEDFIAWTAEVPDGAWRRVLAFVEADTILEALGDTDTAAVTDLIDAVTEAEEALAEALDAAERHIVSVAFLEDFLARRSAQATLANSTHSDHLLSQVRGDE